MSALIATNERLEGSSPRADCSCSPDERVAGCNGSLLRAEHWCDMSESLVLSIQFRE
ncbi:hypothetical protein RAB80_014453 [Fusarium oxysporum f. sp. vasinfectum]|nr:hypothetical protein RAB80_014453 [Fusarium oxysporum f. sp. vasinfectum]